ncbi:MAG: hypothetical protein QF486_02410 [Candidatus Woesearchaeota archaeon]|nr:hypothetical protein [Candidatus Woesearchaeota archaeon]MDP7181405.1 hypothetical protein [Candidatus Woesearchaeota archaeon]MDP7198447.1 hypothetical protein [Candidatus Woesearchaeota archaeon]MDP7466811.1 hypothetical protein [Candidatus Woesearchaeota archaeon]MDP7648036.1 hypothetical protein [Candidatus Woesearchaeota archaeon]
MKKWRKAVVAGMLAALPLIHQMREIIAKTTMRRVIPDTPVEGYTRPEGASDAALSKDLQKVEEDIVKAVQAYEEDDLQSAKAFIIDAIDRYHDNLEYVRESGRDTGTLNELYLKLDVASVKITQALLDQRGEKLLQETDAVIAGAEKQMHVNGYLSWARKTLQEKQQELSKLLADLKRESYSIVGISKRVEKISKLLEQLTPLEKVQAANSKVRDWVLNHFCQKSSFTDRLFINRVKDCESQFKFHETGDDKLYFTHPGPLAKAQQDVKKLTLYPGNVEYGDDRAASSRFSDGLRLNRGMHFHGVGFRFPAKHLNVGPDDRYVREIGGVRFEITMTELINAKRYVYGGSRRLEITDKAWIYNVGSRISAKGDQSLIRLVKRIGGWSKESKMQRAMDFVSKGIPYTSQEGEVLQYMFEVLMSNEADCSSHMVAYASLLEQMGVDYIILYIKYGHRLNHAAVAVTGNFSKRNGFAFEYDGKVYHVADPTIEGWQIGRTYFPKGGGFGVKDVLAVQKPGGSVVQVKLTALR